MPLIFNKNINNNKIGVWETTESLRELEILSDNISHSHLKSIKRKKEFLSVRSLLRIIHDESEIVYNKYGAPELRKKGHISISHSNNNSCIIISDKKNGVDIETISEKALQSSIRFANDHHLNNITKEKATLIWCIKESIFKWHQKGNIDFKKDIIIPKFTIKEKGSLNLMFKNQLVCVNYFKLKDQFLSYFCG